MWTAETFHSEFRKQMKLCLYGDHRYMHRLNDSELRKRFKEKKHSVSSFIISEDELKRYMDEAAFECSEDVAMWLNSPIKLKRDWTFEIEYAFDEKLAKIITKINGTTIEAYCSDLYIILTKVQLSDGGFTFKITTEYCELTPQERAFETKRRGL